MDTSEIIAHANLAKIPTDAPMWCDSAEPDRIKSWRRAGYHAMPVSKESGSIQAQIDYLKSHRLVIHPSCENLIAEISAWKWQKDTATGEYLDSPCACADDAIAALRYAIVGERKGRRLKTIPKNLLYI